MKKFWGSLVLCFVFASVPATLAQTTAVSATVVDSDSTTWINAPWTISLVPTASQPNPNAYSVNGTPLTPSQITQTGTLDGSGNLSVTVYSNASIAPAGSLWNLSICPLASVSCSSFIFQASGSTQIISSSLTAAITAPRFLAVPGSYGYADVETRSTVPIGATYFNSTSLVQRCNNGSSWAACSSGGTGTVTAVTGTSPLASTGGATPALSCPTCYITNQSITVQAIQEGATALTSGYFFAVNNAGLGWLGFNSNTSSGNWTGSQIGFDSNSNLYIQKCNSGTTFNATTGCTTTMTIGVNATNHTSGFQYSLGMPTLPSNGAGWTLPIEVAVTSATGGTNTGTVTCLTASCTTTGGTYSVAGGTFTTGNLLVLVWPSTGTAYHCSVVQNGGTTNFGLGHPLATATGLTITNAVTVAGVTVTFDYTCLP